MPETVNGLLTRNEENVHHNCRKSWLNINQQQSAREQKNIKYKWAVFISVVGVKYTQTHRRYQECDRLLWGIKGLRFTSNCSNSP